MKNKLLFVLSAIGLLLGIYSAYIYAQQPRPQPPLFNPASNPYAKGIYADGIIESDQPQGDNINIYPEVSGPITSVLALEGQSVRKGDPLLTIDDSVQRATAAQQQAQAEAAQSLLSELEAEPRPEALNVAEAQERNAEATVKTAQDEFDKQQHVYHLDPDAVSRETLDTDRDALQVAKTNLQVVTKQYELVKAGAWSYDIANQERQFTALSMAHAASEALLSKYTIRAPADGVVLSVAAAVGSYVSAAGAYNSYTEGYGPVIVMGSPQQKLDVRTYVDEILVDRIPDAAKIDAQMFIRGTDTRIPLQFVRVEPYIAPKIELSDQREERVDVRVLPLIFRFDKPDNLKLYPGELVDVYIGEK
jgi:HlyD family secretion protein